MACPLGSRERNYKYSKKPYVGSSNQLTIRRSVPFGLMKIVLSTIGRMNRTHLCTIWGERPMLFLPFS